MGRKWTWILLMALVFSFLGCARERTIRLEGKTMGTTWHITCVLPRSGDEKAVAAMVEERLEMVNQQMSVFRKESEISRFNRMRAGERLLVSPEFFRLMKESRWIHGATKGAWNPTIFPLVDLWGFGPGKKRGTVPDAAAIEAAKKRIGFSNILFHADGTLGKQVDGVTLDLASIAKGYGVDLVAKGLSDLGVEKYLVEVGGELRVAGCRQDGTPWGIGINLPRPGAAKDAVMTRLDICEGAVATSGDYRNFFATDGKKFSHIIDPFTGYPVTSDIVSVTIRHENCMTADAIATGMMVMDVADALSLAESLDGVACLIVRKTESGELESHHSKGFFPEAASDAGRE